LHLLKITLPLQSRSEKLITLFEQCKNYQTED